MACRHDPWIGNTVGRHRTWNAIIAFVLHGQFLALLAKIHLGQHTGLDEIGCDIPSLHIDKTYYRMTSGVACNHNPWKTHKIGRSWALELIIALG